MPPIHPSRSKRLAQKIDAPRANVYQIRVKGQLDSQWTEWFDSMTIAPQENGDAILSGIIVDQAALFGLLKKVRDLGMVLVSVQCVENALPDAAEGKRKTCTQRSKNRERARVKPQTS